MKICLNRTTAGGSMPFEEFIHLAAEAGFEGADVDMAWAAQRGAANLRDLYQSKNLTYGGWGIPFDWRAAAALSSDDLKKLTDQARIAGEVGIDSCSTWLLPSSDLPFHQNWHFHIQRLSPIAKALADRGLRFGLEFVSPYHLRRKWKHEFIFTPMAMLELAADVGTNCGLLVDSFHLHAAGEPMNVLERIPVEKIVLVHVNDTPAGPLSAVEDGKRLLPGEGVVDLAGFFNGLEKLGYTGPISVEVFSESLRAMPPAEAARLAWTKTREAFTAVRMDGARSST